MEGPISFWRYKEQESNIILPERDDDNDDDDDDYDKERLSRSIKFYSARKFAK
jgi:hypothetical protein